jgi:hypothetical protein
VIDQMDVDCFLSLLDASREHFDRLRSLAHASLRRGDLAAAFLNWAGCPSGKLNLGPLNLGAMLSEGLSGEWLRSILPYVDLEDEDRGSASAMLSAFRRRDRAAVQALLDAGAGTFDGEAVWAEELGAAFAAEDTAPLAEVLLCARHDLLSPSLQARLWDLPSPAFRQGRGWTPELTLPRARLLERFATAGRLPSPWKPALGVMIDAVCASPAGDKRRDCLVRAVTAMVCTLPRAGVLQLMTGGREVGLYRVASAYGGCLEQLLERLRPRQGSVGR